MSHESVTTFIVTIFNLSHPNKTLIQNGIIELSHNNERYSFNLNEIELPQSCTFYSNTIDTVHLNLSSKHHCSIDIPFDLYFSDTIINEFVMRNGTDTDTDSQNMIDLIPPTITLSLTAVLPLPYILTHSSDSDSDSDTHLMYHFLNNSVPSPIYELNLSPNTKESKIFDLVCSFIAESNANPQIWNQINECLKHTAHRHMTLIAVFHRLNSVSNHKIINNKYIITHDTYKLLYQLLDTALHCANMSHKSIDIITFYLVLCIGKITYYQHNSHFNCLIDDFGYNAWLNLEAMSRLRHYLLSQNESATTKQLSYLRMIVSFILLHQTENSHMPNKLNKLYSKLSLIKDICTANAQCNAYLFEWLIKPISDLLLAMDSKTNKSAKLSNILSSANANNNNHSVFGYLYNNERLDTSYHCVFENYYKYMHSIQTLSKQTSKAQKTETEQKSENISSTIDGEPILKHYISNYAVLDRSIPALPRMSSNKSNEDFCFLEQINNDNGNAQMFESFETMHYLNEDIGGEQECIALTKHSIFNKMRDGIAIVIPGLPLMNGFLKLTNYRLLFVPFQKHCLQCSKTYTNYFEIPIGSVYSIALSHIDKTHKINALNKQLLSFDNICDIFVYKYLLEIATKDGRNVQFVFANISENNLNKFIAELKRIAFANGDITQCFAVQTNDLQKSKKKGWNVYDIFAEFTRQKVPFSFDPSNEDSNNNKWRISVINKEYKYCETYPNYFIVPSSISDSDLQSIKSSNNGQSQPFRSKSRIPVLTYYHSSNGAAILRSSQPMTGMGGLGGFVSTSWWSQNTCKADEKLLRESRIKYIIDARPKMNAVVNQAAGGGYENTVDVYKGMRLIFGNIHNIHEVRKSFDQVSKAVHDSLERLNHSLHIAHLKYMYLGYKSVTEEKKEIQESVMQINDDFGVISSNQPFISEQFNDTKSSSSAGELWKMGIKSVKSVAKHAHSTMKDGGSNKKNRANQMKKSRSWQASPKSESKNERKNINLSY